MALLVVVGAVSGGLDILGTPKKVLAAGATQLPSPAGQPGTFGGPGNSDQESLAITESTSPKTLIESPVTWVKLYFSPADAGLGILKLFNMPFECDQYVAGGDWSMVEHGGSCPFPGIPDDTNDQVLYDFYNTDANENPTSLIYTIDGQTGKDFNNPAITRATGVGSGTWTGNINLPLAGTALSARTNYYVVLMRARWGNCPSALTADCQNPLVPPPPAFGTTRLHAYLVQTPQAQDNVGYWAQNGVTGTGTYPTFGSFTMHDIGTGVDYDIQNVETDFAPPCTLTSPETATIRWKNGDSSDVTNNPGHDGNANTAYPTANPWSPSGSDIANSFQLFGVSPTGVRSLVETMPGGSTGFGQQNLPGNPLPATGTNANGVGAVNNIGGFQDYREVNFTAQPGYKYQWIWHNVDAYFEGTAGQDPPTNAHNIQMWIPYDSINYAITCGYNYSSNIDIADGKTAGQQLDVSQPADLHVEFNVDGSNSGPSNGPVATTVPTCTENGAACVATDITPDATPQGNLNQSIPANTTIDGGSVVPKVVFGYTIASTVADGTVFCFSDTIAPVTGANPGPANGTNQVCYTVKSSKSFPAIVGQNGDVHAGGGLCGQALSTGSITGSGFAASEDEYVLSASGTIQNFASNSGGADDLKIGSNGGYASVCRPDLLTVANDYYASGGGGIQTIGVSASPTTWSATGKSGLYYFQGGGELDISGTISNKITLVVPSARVVVNGTLAIDNTVNGGNCSTVSSCTIPSLGVIAGGNIDILSSVTQVDAYLFADGTINTCGLAASPDSPCGVTSPVLDVNGFLMAQNILFSRLGPGSAGQQVAEQITLNPELYLNPPQFFDEASDNGSSLEGQGERPPLF